MVINRSTLYTKETLTNWAIIWVPKEMGPGLCGNRSAGRLKISYAIIAQSVERRHGKAKVNSSILFDGSRTVVNKSQQHA